MYTGKSQEQRAKAKMAARRKAYNKEVKFQKRVKFIVNTIINSATSLLYVAILGLLAYISIAF